MRSLGTLGGDPSALAFGVNTHRWVVGASITTDELSRPFLWMPRQGIQSLPTLGGDRGEAKHLNELGQIVGTTATANGAFRATLWTPTAGLLVVAPTGEGAAAEVAVP
jgi:uncharacterized membrane protein